VDAVGPLTRRGLARLTAGALGASLVGRGPDAANAFAEPLWSAPVGTVRAGTTAMTRSRRFELIGVQYAGDPDAAVRIRVQHPDGTLSDWFDARRRHGGVAEPIWTGPAVAWQLSAATGIEDVTVHLVAPAAATASAAAKAPAYGPAPLPVLPAGPGQPPIIPRARWATPACAPRVPPSFGQIDVAFVHHTDGSNAYSRRQSAAMVVGICLFHERVNGWHDIGYNFLVDRYGQVFEGRAGGIDEPVIGAHAGGYNAHSTGVAVMGTFVGAAPPPAAIGSLQRLLAWKLALHGVPATGTVGVRAGADIVFYGAYRPGQLVRLKRVSGHRDGDQTDCPGDALYRRLPAIRPHVAALAGPTYTLSLTVTPLAHPTPIATTTLSASGTLATAGGAPLAGATVQLQSRTLQGATTIATATTAADGSWQAPLTLAQTTDLRALHADAPAVVSPAVAVGIAPAVTLSVTPGLTPGVYVATGTISPAKRKVVIDVNELLAPSGKKRIVHRTVKAPAAGYAASAKLTKPGTYVVVARTLADAVNAAGASVPVQVVVPAPASPAQPQ